MSWKALLLLLLCSEVLVTNRGPIDKMQQIKSTKCSRYLTVEHLGSYFLHLGSYFHHHNYLLQSLLLSPLPLLLLLLSLLLMIKLGYERTEEQEFGGNKGSGGGGGAGRIPAQV